jgi:hypothetical protein
MILIRLSLNSGPHIFEFRLSRVTVGSAPECALRLPGAAPHHAMIYYKNGTWFLMDMGTPLGTILNGKAVSSDLPHPLAIGDRIIVGTDCVTVQQLQADMPPVPGTIRAPEPAPPAPGTFCPICGTMITGAACPNCYCKAPTAPIPGLAVPPCAPSQRAPSFPDASRPILVPPSSMPAPKAAPMPAPAAPSAKKTASAKKEGFFSSLFRQKEPAKQPLQADDVQFRAAAPASLTRGEYFTVKVMMYREDDYQRADREQQALADKVKSASSSIFKASHNETFRIALQSPDIPMDTESADLVWNGTYATADMEVLLPENYDRRQLRLNGRVYSGLAVLTDLKLILQVESPVAQQPVMEKCHMRSAFISYASQDRAKVVARIQGIQLSRPDMDIFFDAESLRRGEHWEQRLYKEIEDRDLFYLFWSRNAAGSSWVSRELAYAMEHKGAGAVEPVPLEDPATCPPPACLQDRHFNDWTLRYLRDQ